jgi:uncharacterized protein
MRDLQRIVVDTNVFVSAIVLPLSVPRQAVDKVLNGGSPLFSQATMDELIEVLTRRKFNPYVRAEERMLFLGQLGSSVEFVPIIQLVRECRDPKDDKFLDVALNGKADVILTGDADLLGKNPWRGVEVLSPAEYLKRAE